MKITLFINHGDHTLDFAFKKEMVGDNMLEKRISFAAFLEKLPFTQENEAGLNDINALLNSKNNKSYIKTKRNPNIIIVKNGKNKINTVLLLIKDIDISKIWKIDDYDGVESITYHKEPVILNEQYNYAEF